MTIRVLIIGHTAKEVKSLLDALKADSQFMGRFVTFVDGEMDGILKFKPDIIVLLPLQTFESVRPHYHRLRKEPATSDIPLTVILSEDDFRRQELPQGIQDVFCTPLRIQECLARLMALHRRFHRIADKDVIRSGPLEMDVSRYEVKLADRKVDLTYTEYELLKFMIGHPGQVFTRDVLLNKVWGYEYFGGARTVDVHVRRLRSKIELKSHRFIDTVRNIGYKFIAGEDEGS